MKYLEIMVNEFCNQLAINQRGIRNMHSYYVFSDHRTGTVRERFERDAAEFFEYQKLLRGNTL
jgi:hypothetical protein